MPELPEVETVVRSLRAKISGQEILAARVSPRGERALGGVYPETFSEKLVGSTINEITRRGKFIVFELNGQRGRHYAVAHLRMTGRFIFQPGSGEAELLLPKYLVSDGPARYEADASKKLALELEEYWCIELQLTHGKLIFADKRRFGTFHLVDDLAGYPGIANLGPDALLDDTPLAALQSRLNRSNRPIYSTLLDQTVIAGLGNIYVCETLAQTRISPLRPSSAITVAELALLLKTAKAILASAIAAKGTSFSDYRTTEGEPGGYQKRLMVYGQKSTTIAGQDYSVARIKIGGRTVHYFPDLQT